MSRGSHPHGSRRGEVVKTLHDLLSDVYSEMDGLKGELQEWLDNMPENLQDGSKAEELREAIEAIEQVDEIECPTKLEKQEVKWVESTKRRKSRAARRDDCTAAMLAALEMLEELGDDQYDALKAEIDSAMEEYEGVDFPGMH